MIPPAFDYHAPKTVGEAIALLGSLGSDARLLAGGHSLLPMMKLRFATPAHLIDINRIPELRGIREDAKISFGSIGGKRIYSFLGILSKGRSTCLGKSNFVSQSIQTEGRSGLSECKIGKFSFGGA